jgi:hypothetical protein
MEQTRKEQSIDATHSLEEKPSVEKRCLNCQSVLHGKYCSVCGQRDTELHEPFWKLISEFISDFFHFDSKFFETFTPLLFRPGYLTTEYVSGRRMRYVHPIRLYFFVSVLFFLCYFSFGKSEFFGGRTESLPGDSAVHQVAEADSVTVIGNELAHLNISKQKREKINGQEEKQLEREAALPSTIEAYDDSIHRLPEDSIPGFLQQVVDRRIIEAREKGDKAVIAEILEVVNHELPKIMFLLLPVFALWLKLLYIRRRVYFEDHAVFSLHFHSFAFVLFLLALIVSLFLKQFSLMGWVVAGLLLYLFFSLRRMHGQSITKTVVKVFILLFLYATSVGLVMLGLFIYAAMIA